MRCPEFRGTEEGAIINPGLAISPLSREWPVLLESIQFTPSSVVLARTACELQTR